MSISRKSSKAIHYFISVTSVILILLTILLSSQAVLADPGWVIQTVDSTANTGRNTSIALDNNGYPHISYYYGPGGDLMYTRWNGTSWDTPTTVDSAGEVGMSTSIDIDSNGYPHISYFDNTNRRIKYASYNGTAWSTGFVDIAETGHFGTSLKLDQNDHPHISYCHYFNRDLKYAYHDGTSWQITPLDSDGLVGYYSSLALYQNEYPHISYLDGTNQKLKYASYNGTAWNFQSLYDCGSVAEDSPYKQYTSLALDSNGYPHISYFESSGSDLMYARYNGTAWTNETVDSEGNAGGYDSLALDGDDRPHISYLGPWEIGGDPWTLRYAYYNGATWEIQDVENYGGQYTSIAVDQYNRPHISNLHTSGLRYYRLNKAPGINTVNPGSGNQGQNIPVTITGYSFTGATMVSFGASITVNNFIVDNDNQITANISISVDAELGARNVSVTTPDGTATKTNTFNVTGTPPPVPVPAPTPSSAPTIYTPNPARIIVPRVTVEPKQAAANQPVTIYANVVNRGDLPGTYTAELKINDEIVQTKSGGIDANMGTPLKFTIYKDQPGTYEVEINGQKSFFTIVDSNNTIDKSTTHPNIFVYLFVITLILVIIISMILVTRHLKQPDCY